MAITIENVDEIRWLEAYLVMKEIMDSEDEDNKHVTTWQLNFHIKVLSGGLTVFQIKDSYNNVIAEGQSDSISQSAEIARDQLVSRYFESDKIMQIVEEACHIYQGSSSLIFTIDTFEEALKRRFKIGVSRQEIRSMLSKCLRVVRIEGGEHCAVLPGGYSRFKEK